MLNNHLGLRPRWLCTTSLRYLNYNRYLTEGNILDIKSVGWSASLSFRHFFSTSWVVCANSAWFWRNALILLWCEQLPVISLCSFLVANFPTMIPLPPWIYVRLPQPRPWYMMWYTAYNYFFSWQDWPTIFRRMNALMVNNMWNLIVLL